MLLGKTKSGWAVPIRLAFKADYIGMEDFGLTAHLTKIRTSFYYAMTSIDNLQVQLMTQRFYEKAMQFSCENPRDLTKVYLSRIIPILLFFAKSKNQH